MKNNKPLNTDITKQQSDEIYTQVRELAELMIAIQAIEKDTNAKSTVIGRAMLHQEAALNSVITTVDEQAKHQTNCFQEAKTHQDTVSKDMDELIQIALSFGNVDKRQDMLLENITTLRANHQKFVENTRSQSQNVSDHLVQITNELISLKTQVNALALEDQVAFINHKIAEIQASLQICNEERRQVHITMKSQLSFIEDKINMVSKNITTQVETVAEIQTYAKAYELKTKQMCDKLDEVIIKYQAKDELENMTLAEMFTQPDIVKTPKKKGLFARLFGGK